MKKHAKKLSLNRETLRHLESGEVMRAAGGSANCTSVVCIAPTGCECETMDGCAPHTAAMNTCSMGGTSYTCGPTWHLC